MLPTQRAGLVLVLAAVIAAAGLVDASAGRAWDLAVILALVVGLLAIVLAGLRAHRRAISVRPDLAGWLREQAAATGEPVERLTDRAVAAYRAGLTADPGERS